MHRRVLHDRERGNIVSGEPGKIRGGHFDTVDENQRVGLAGTEGSDSADKKVCGIFTRLSGALVLNHAGNLAGKCGSQVAARDLQFSGLDGRDGGEHTLLLLGAECHCHRLFELILVLRQFDIDDPLVGDSDGLGHHAHECDHDLLVRGDLDFIGTVQVCYNYALGVGNLNRCSRKRQPFSIQDVSLDGLKSLDRMFRIRL